jgi:endonuclease YncB( thermonuclease family)
MHLRRTCFLLLSVALGAANGALSQERIAGRAKIIDGDSFEIGSAGVRLFGVDAPEGRQPCTRSNGSSWRCGDAAAAELRRLVGSREVACVRRDTDDYGRVVGVCRVGSLDLGAAMVRAGLAVAYRRYSDDYVDEEREAQAARRGLWAGEFVMPEEYRRDERSATREPRPRVSEERRAARPSTPRRDGCSIKGNINGDGEKIYHVPDSSSYRSTEIDESRGERWFCTESEARRAGWRAPRG